MQIHPIDPWTIMPQICFLCAHELTPHEAETRGAGYSFGMCSACAALGRRVGKSKIYLVVSPGEYQAGMFSKSEFMESLKLTVHWVVRDQLTDEVHKIFDTENAARAWFRKANPLRRYWAFDANDSHIILREQAHTWPIGMEVEIWDRYHYTGTFIVWPHNATKRHLLELINAEPKGTSAYIHNEFPESEPQYRYRRLLDPNWQMKLPSRIAQWRKVGGKDKQSVGGLPRIEAWRIPHVTDKIYQFWEARG